MFVVFDAPQGGIKVAIYAPFVVHVLEMQQSVQINLAKGGGSYQVTVAKTKEQTFASVLQRIQEAIHQNCDSLLAAFTADTNLSALEERVLGRLGQAVDQKIEQARPIMRQAAAEAVADLAKAEADAMAGALEDLAEKPPAAKGKKAK